jgi:NTE family protein
MLLLLGGCSPQRRNQPIERAEPNAGYRFDTLALNEGNTDSTFVCLTFSGGGARAAALAYGVMQELRDTPIAPITPNGPPRRMLDEVDTISSVSGGSFTAAGYALWGDGLFDGRFEHNFIRRNIQESLILRVLSLQGILGLPLVFLDRIDVAAEYFNARIFGKKTYADLLQQPHRPLVVINATNLATGRRFGFTQDDFDVLGSDLASVSVGYAVGASQAVPLVFSPMRLRYYDNDVSRQTIRELLSQQHNRLEETRREQWAGRLVPKTQPGESPVYAIDTQHHRYLYLMDGVVSDNLGLVDVMESFQSGIIHQRLTCEGPQAIKLLVIIVVNADTIPPNNIEKHKSAPGLFTMGYQSAITNIQNKSRWLISSLRNTLLEEGRRTRDRYKQYEESLKKCCPNGKPLERPYEACFTPYVIEINVADYAEGATKNDLMLIGTNYQLTQRQADIEIEAGRRLLRDNADFQRLLADINTGQSSPPPAEHSSPLP